MRARTLTLVVTVAWLAGCSGEGGEAGGIAQVTRDTVGDTIIVRSGPRGPWGTARLVEEVRIGQLDGPDEYTFGQLAGILAGPDGTVYVLDHLPPSLRAYSPDGTFLRQIAGEGEGPGELNGPDWGLASLPDGRILVRDPQSARVTVFDAQGEHETEWRINPDFGTSTPLYVDRAGNAYLQHMDFGEEGPVFSFVRYGPDGEPADTIPVPGEDDAPQLMAVNESESGRSMSSMRIPFWPDLAVTFSPDGGMTIGRPDVYSIDVPREGEVLRVEREFTPVAVLGGERDNFRERTTHNLRRVDPGWDWDGPPIPDTKPAFRGIDFDMDGRLWTNLYATAERIPDDEIEWPDPDDDAPPPVRWREPRLFDVFAADGSYLGQVSAPRGLLWTPRPAITGDRVWAVVRDELDLNYVVRFRIVREGDPR